MKTVAYHLDTGNKLNVHKSFRKHPELLLNVLYTFSLLSVFKSYPVNIYSFEVNNRNTRKRCEIF